ncbi:TfoX/Sxy family protein [Rhizohabitans arisaemae]|uniref:TfoX/Sxy family protein n=1 Tax=Rhizohabitans arisaemae TaxID=2720610 RepID=UPI0024B130E1|nr:TfoX/Sxy family protein [Rhizohabitans arisaemae]
MTRLRELRNLGPKSEQWLALVDIRDAEQLLEVGPLEAYRRLQDAAVPGLSLNALWAMEGALADIDWRHIPAERKRELLAELAGGSPDGQSREPGRMRPVS